MAASFFQNVGMAAPVQVFQLNKLCNESQDPNKVNLGVGAYRTDEGKPWVLPIVKEAEIQMANDKTLNHEYLPISGLPDFRSSAINLLLGSDHQAVVENRVEGFQALGGTGALRLAASFLVNVLKFNTVYVSNPTWGNHKGLFKAAGCSNIKEYRYWNNDTRDLNITGMIEDLSNAPEDSVVILHAVAHNPTGVDPTDEQWEMIHKTCKEKKLFVVMDIAYQGFASGDLDLDARAARLFAADTELFICQSFSKNFGLYNERTGNLIVVTDGGNKLPEIRSQMEIIIREMWSNPPNHGARIVATVLNNKAFFESWKSDVRVMSERIKKMRQELFAHLRDLSTPGNWSHIIKQIGMFSYTGLTGKQVEMLKTEYRIFLLSSGRISMSGLNSKNVGYVAKAIDAAVRAHPSN